MSTTTEKWGLFKPELTDPADITKMNRNWDIIDEQLNNIPITNEVPSNAEMWIDPDDVSAEEAHLTNMNNPHNVTITQIGAAPIGYGLGEYITSNTLVTDANLATLTGKYRIADTTANGIGVFATLDVVGYGTSHTTQIAYAASSSNIQKRQRINGNWGEWEWVDPPLQLDVEYRTTKRYKGNPVYMKLINIGEVPSASGKSVAHGISGCRPIKCTGQITNSSTTLPYVSTSGSRIDISATPSAINIYSNFTQSSGSSSVEVLLEYYKV